MADWKFLTKHGRALLCIAIDPGVRLRDIALELEITERSAYAIVGDLATAGYVVKEREGRRNRYVIQTDLQLPEGSVNERTIGEILDVFLAPKARRSA
jgi:DNA-binding MarR family transcriptional regulator